MSDPCRKCFSHSHGPPENSHTLLWLDYASLRAPRLLNARELSDSSWPLAQQPERLVIPCIDGLRQVGHMSSVKGHSGARRSFIGMVRVT